MINLVVPCLKCREKVSLLALFQIISYVRPALGQGSTAIVHELLKLSSVVCGGENLCQQKAWEVTLEVVGEKSSEALFQPCSI